MPCFGMAIIGPKILSFSTYVHVFIIFYIVIDGRQKYDGKIDLFIDDREYKRCFKKRISWSNHHVRSFFDKTSYAGREISF
jgi:hypothetical protein